MNQQTLFDEPVAPPEHPCETIRCGYRRGFREDGYTCGCGHSMARLKRMAAVVKEAGGWRSWDDLPAGREFNLELCKRLETTQ